MQAFYFHQVTHDPIFELVAMLVAFGQDNKVECVLALRGSSTTVKIATEFDLDRALPTLADDSEVGFFA